MIRSVADAPWFAEADPDLKLGELTPKTTAEVVLRSFGGGHAVNPPPTCGGGNCRGCGSRERGDDRARRCRGSLRCRRCSHDEQLLPRQDGSATCSTRYGSIGVCAASCAPGRRSSKHPDRRSSPRLGAGPRCLASPTCGNRRPTAPGDSINGSRSPSASATPYSATRVRLGDREPSDAFSEPSSGPSRADKIPSQLGWLSRGPRRRRSSRPTSLRNEEGTVLVHASPAEELKAASNEARAGAIAFRFRTIVSASGAPTRRSIPASSHSTLTGPT